MFRQILALVVCACGFLACQQANGAEYVRGYTRSNGTYVAPYFRTHADHDFYNNWSTYPNINPYTGQMGTRHSPPYSVRYSYPSYGSWSYPAYGWDR